MSALSVLPKPIFNIHHEPLTSAEEEKLRNLNIFYECGRDKHDRLIIAVAACHFPESKLINHDDILTHFVSKLTELKQEFVIVFFSSCVKYKPSFLWCIRAYKMLNHFFHQKYLKELYVVHMPHYFQHLIIMTNKIISSEHTKKMHYLSTLDELDQIINLDKLRIPHQVIEHEIELPHSLFSYHHHYYHADHQHAHHSHHRHHHHTHHHHHYIKKQESKQIIGHFVFGRTLNDLAKLENHNEAEDYVPKIVIRLFDHIIKEGLLTEGIFRKSPSQVDLHEARDCLDRDPNSELEVYDIHTIAALIKMFFSGLPYPLLTSELVTKIKLDRDVKSLEILKDQLIHHFQDRRKHFYLLRYLIDFLSEIANHEQDNKMNIRNLAIVFAPSLVRSTVPLNSILNNPVDASVYLQQTKHHMSVIELLIEQKENLF